MQRTRLRARIAGVLVLVGLLSACSSDALRTAALGLRGAAEANKTLAQTVITAAEQDLISEPDAEVILVSSRKVADAIIVSAELTKDYTEFDGQDVPTLRAALQPALDAVEGALDLGITGIQNPQTKSTVQAALGVVRLALVSATQALE